MKQMTLSDSQITQIHNISETLIEATEHFTTYIKEREFGQSIHIFSAIVEGFEGINQFLNTSDEFSELARTRSEIEKCLFLIADHIEQRNFTKITEIIQFSLMPHFKKVNNVLTDKDEQHTTTTIGIYLDRAQPRKAYSEKRIDALIKESEHQGAQAILFSSEDINFTEEKVNADIFRNGKWETIHTNFPDVIHNIAPVSRHQQSITERKLRRRIPFTSYGVGNKFYLPKTMVKHRRFLELLVPFRMVADEHVVYDYLEKENIAVLKPILGARGESIYFVQKKGNRFVVSEHRQERIYNRDNFHEWIQTVLLNRKFSYMIQRYVECRTKNGEPYDIRAHMQKDSEGKWTTTKIYPRIGSKQSILSNISRGGRTEDLTSLLVDEFGHKKGHTYDKELRQLALELTEYLDRIHNFSLDELGLDLAIDQTGRFWLHEANNGPQSTYHEAERAVHTIGYTIYIARKGIVKHNQFQDVKGQFNAQTSNLPFAKVDDQHRIGMLKSNNDDDALAIACAYVAHYEDVHFYTFTPKDIDYNEMLIKAQFFENGAWVSKIMEYPDVIYDRLRLRGVKGYNDIYEELDGIPFTNEFYGNSISKLEVYDQLKSTGELDDILIPYKKVDRVRDIFQYMETYGAIIVKPEVGSFARGVHYIKKQENNTYFVAESEKETEYSEIALRKYINELLDSGTLIVQQYINTRTIDGHPFDIRVHMMKDGNDEWCFMNVYPRIGMSHAIILLQKNGGYISTNLSGFLNRNFTHKSADNIGQSIQDVSQRVTDTFGTLHEESFNEIALDLALDKDGSPHLIEINVNKPAILNLDFYVARLAIPNAIHLADKTQNYSC